LHTAESDAHDRTRRAEELRQRRIGCGAVAAQGPIPRRQSPSVSVGSDGDHRAAEPIHDLRQDDLGRAIDAQRGAGSAFRCSKEQPGSGSSETVRGPAADRTPAVQSGGERTGIGGTRCFQWLQVRAQHSRSGRSRDRSCRAHTADPGHDHLGAPSELRGVTSPVLREHTHEAAHFAHRHTAARCCDGHPVGAPQGCEPCAGGNELVLVIRGCGGAHPVPPRRCLAGECDIGFNPATSVVSNEDNIHAYTLTAVTGVGAWPRRRRLPIPSGRGLSLTRMVRGMSKPAAARAALQTSKSTAPYVPQPSSVPATVHRLLAGAENRSRTEASAPERLRAGEAPSLRAYLSGSLAPVRLRSGSGQSSWTGALLHPLTIPGGPDASALSLQDARADGCGVRQDPADVVLQIGTWTAFSSEDVCPMLGQDRDR
jgi:hypothetical protein